MPHILHATMVRNHILLWLESPPETDEFHTLLHQEWSAHQGSSWYMSDIAPAYPFQPEQYESQRLLRQVLTTINLFMPPRLTSASLWLPTHKHCPLPSQLAGGQMPPPHLQPRLHPWSVNGQELTILNATILFRNIPHLWGRFPTLQFGYDLAFWATLTQYAAALLEQGKFLPTTHQDAQGTVTAVWEPIFDKTEQLRSAMLARHMPLVCRAWRISGESTAPLAAEEACSVSLQLLVDSQIRLSRANESTHSPLPQSPISPYRAWVHALQATEPQLALPQEVAITWHTHLRAWRMRTEEVMALSARLTWHIFEPLVEDEEEQWLLCPFLEDKADPSLRMPLATTDDEATIAIPSAFVTITTAQQTQMMQYSLALCSHLNRGTTQDVLHTIVLTTPEILTFLTDDAPTLIAAGFGVYFPLWWEEAQKRHVLTLHAAVRQRGDEEAPLSLTALVDFDWEMALGDETLTLTELEALVMQKAGLVRFRKRWITLDQNALQHGLTLIRRRRKATLLQVLQTILDVSDPQIHGVREEFEPQGAIAHIVDYLRGQSTFAELPPPPALHAQLRGYQNRGVSWLDFLTRHGLGALLADDMGLGKTVEALALIQHQRVRPRSGPFLVVTTTSSVANWQQEAQRFCDLNPLIHHGQQRLRADALLEQARHHVLVITSYQILQRDIEHLRQIPWHGVILDEAQQIKNHSTKQSQAARALPSIYRVALTGTPIENSVEDVHSIMSFLNPGLLGSQEQFRQQFVLPIQRQDEQAKARLQRVLAPLILRRRKGDPDIAPELPPKIEQNEYCSLSKEQASLYGAILREMESTLTDLTDTDTVLARKGAIFSTLTRLKQCCNHPAHFLGDQSALTGRSGKLERLEEILANVLENDQHVLIFTQYAEWGRLLQPYLAERFGEEILFLEGKTPSKKRTWMIDRFEHASDGPRVFLISLRAGGTAINLIRATSVIHYDRWWNPAVENQATDRAHRIGQVHTVHVHKLICSGTLEQKIDDLIVSKQQLANEIILTGENDLYKLTTDQLRDVLSLQQEALAAFEPTMGR